MKTTKTLPLIGLLLAASFMSGEALAGDSVAGQMVFRKCAICHSPDPGVNKIGPSLFGVVGRTPGALASFAKRYSPAMKAFGESGAVWDEATLILYLTSPRTLVPKGRMVFPGLKDATQREDVVAYLKTLTDDE